MSGWTEQQVREMYRQYWEDWRTLDEIGDAYGITNSRVGQLFEQYNLRRRTSSEIADAKHEENLQRAQDLRAEITAVYMEHGTLGAVYDRVDLPQEYIREIVNRIPNREAYRRRGGMSRVPPEKLLDDLRTAARLKGQPLTAPAYREAAQELGGLVAYNTLIKEYGTFSAACQAAGIEAGNSKGPYRGTTTAEDCIQAVLDCIIDFNGHRPSFTAYSLWAKDNERPSGPTVRLRVPGGWNGAVGEALARYNAMR